MAWCWSYKSVPELAQFPEWRRREIWAECRQAVCQRYWWGRNLLIVVIAVLIAGGVGYRVLLKGVPADDYREDLLSLAAGTALVAALLSLDQYLKRRARQYLRGRMGTHCRACDYDLRGNVSGACPECGAFNPFSQPPGWWFRG